MSGIDNIFNQIPVEEVTTSNVGAGSTEVNERITKGDVGSRIDAFADLADEDQYGEDDKKGYEAVKVEKDKVPTSRTEDEKKEKREEDEGNEEQESGDVEVKEEPQTQKPEDQKFKVKVDGREEEVTLEQLKADYSGKQAISRRFNEFNKEKVNFEKEVAAHNDEVLFIQREVAELKDGFESIVQDYKKNGFLSKNPMAAINTLLDKMNINSYDFERAMFEHQLPEYAKFFEMDEVQQDAYFAKKENEFLRKKDQTFAERTQKTQAETARQQQEYNLIKSAGLTSEQYNELFGELESLGDKNITAERVVEFARVKPILDKAGSIVAKTKSAGDSAKINQVAELLSMFPDTTEDEIISHIDGAQKAQQVSKSLKDKEDFTVKTKPKKAVGSDFTDEDEDFDMEFFKSLRK